ncbi:AlbA family DNA-binding domain-containing protein [Burkholderia seminalis]|uniref:AlbA family DNA-binding domain-containing protein n=1 Tax=Burkholderia seminalis TaxID=488731 RepID=UPI000F5B22E1|nr:ATP-binding protein [Burkholderia seminalis]RQS69907.1 ATP-binding protein [Burkholderia seminalis]
MYDTIEEIASLFGEIAESVSLEFKSGRMLDKLTSDVRSELVKDVTAFANAGGGTIVIGIGEDRSGNSNTASKFEVVSNTQVSVDQLGSIVKSNSDPVFGAFEIRELRHDGGRIFVIEIEQGDTAHQSKCDKRYYQRTGTSSEAMYDFAIRDVMNRRTRASVTIEFEIERLDNPSNAGQPIYRIIPFLRNDGNVTARHWALYFYLPAAVAKIGSVRAGMPVRHLGNIEHNGIEYTRVELHSGPTPIDQAGTLLLPGQRHRLTLDRWFAELDLGVTDYMRTQLERSAPPVRWSFFLDDAPRRDGEIPFSVWCKS